MTDHRLTVYFDNEVVILEDVMEESPEKYKALVTMMDTGILINLVRPGDEDLFASVVIENHEGTPKLHYWLTGDLGNDPKTIELDAEIDLLEE